MANNLGIRGPLLDIEARLAIAAHHEAGHIVDPQSVFDELVPYFRNARKRRQVIVVTHNANLVVNTDADQIIIATSTRETEGGLPLISYESGSLENPKVRAAVCRLLEGGQRAFLERERHYRLNWGAADADGRDDLSCNFHESVVKSRHECAPFENIYSGPIA